MVFSFTHRLSEALGPRSLGQAAGCAALFQVTLRSNHDCSRIQFSIGHDESVVAGRDTLISKCLKEVRRYDGKK